MRILLSTGHAPADDDVTRFIDDLAITLRNLGPEVFILSPVVGDPAGWLLEGARGPIESFRRVTFAPAPGAQDFRALAGAAINYRGMISDLASVILRHGIDVVHHHLLDHMGLYLAPACRRGNTRLVVTMHGQDVFDAVDSRALRMSRHRMARQARFLSSASTVAKRARALWSLNSTVVYNGIDMRRLEGQEPARRERPYVLCADALVSRERPRLVLDAFARLCESTPDIDLLVLGDGPARSNLEERVDELGLADRVVFTGAVPYEQKVALMMGCHVFVRASNEATLPMTLIEATACGAPIVCAATDAHRDVVTDGLNGRLVPFESSQHVSEVLREVLGAPSARERMRTAGERVARERFGIDKLALEHLKIYREVGGPA